MQAGSMGVSWVFLLLFSGAGALPVGGPPLALDPTLSSVAPQECLWYAAYAGQGPASAESANQTEQLYAEPQVQRFAQEIESQIMQAVRRAGGPDRQRRVVAEQLPKLVKIALTRSSAAYLEKVEFRGDDGREVDVTGALVVNAGEQRDEMRGAIEALLALVPPDKAPKLEQAAGVEWRRAPTPPEAPVVRFGWKDEYFIVAVGQDAPAQVVERMTGDAPQWLAELRAEHPVEREMSLAYLNVEGVLAVVRPLVESRDPAAWPIVEKLGLAHLRAVHSVAGYDKVGCTSAVHLVTRDGSRPGVLGLLPHGSLEAGDLALVPKDPLLAAAVRVEASELFERVVELATTLDARTEENVARALWDLNTHLGIDLRADVLGSLDDVWTVYLPGGDLMTSWFNAAAAVKVKDAPRLQEAVGKIIEVAKLEMARHPQRPTISETTAGGRTLYTLQFGQPTPVTPSWCISDGWLVAGLSPQAVRAALERKPADSLAEAEAVAAAIAAEGGVAALTYQDTPRLVRSLYPWLNMGLQMASGELRKQGIDFDLSTIPTEEAIVKHLRPSLATWSHREDGFHVRSEGSLPGGGNFAAAAPIGVAVLVPAVGSAREAARRSQDMNSLKQIALAMHIYHDIHKGFPTDVYSEDGKPLLSWRIELLPYLEEKALYDQFRRDEPWDSDHNRNLLGQMPAVFRSLRGQADPTKTRFLALAGPDGIIAGEEPVALKDITDGTSATLMFVEAAPERAVEWSRPADIEFNPEKPFAGVSGPVGSFLAAMCDGSVRSYSLAIGADMMRRLANRHDDEVVDVEQLNMPPAPELHQPAAPER